MKDEAVSSVVAAVLVFSLFSTGFLLWTINTMPEWIADKEHDHIRGIQNDFAALQGNLEGLSGSGQSGPISATIDLAANPIPLVQQTGNRGELSLGGDFAMDATLTSPQLYALNGQLVGAASKTTDGTHDDIAELRLLELQLNDAGSLLTSITATARPAGLSTPTVTLTFQHSTDECLRVLIDGTDADTTADRQTLVTCGVADASPGKSINALSPEYGLKSVLAELGGAFDLTVSVSSAAGSYAATWIDTDGRPSVAGTGTTGTYDPDVAGKSLVFSSNVQRFKDQDIYWDGGAVIASQFPLSSVVREPSFLISEDTVNDVGYLRWTIVELDGSGNVNGAGQTTALLSHDSTETALFTTTSASFAITSDVSAAWEQFFEDEIDLNGITSATVTTGATPTLNLNTSGVTEWIIELRIIHATVEIN